MTTDGKVALITGSARRVGADIARSLHQAGFNIALHYHQSETEAHALCDELNNIRTHSAIIFQADLSNIPQLKQLVDKTVEAFGRLDVLVNNASRYYKTAIGTAGEDQWDDLMTSNLKAPFFLCQAAIPFLTKTKGCIVNIADVHGERPMRDYGVYCISKAGLLMLTKTLAKELGPDIRVNAVSPGSVLLPEGENLLSKEAQENIIRRVALRRHGTPNDIAKAVLYLAVHADYVTGSVLPVDGGRSLMI
ncbi:MAG TPA: pteridine reductase [Gammaproteobacteria bacterium]|nr:pteridine reductase [Gammaproteobacteria bacterium]